MPRELFIVDASVVIDFSAVDGAAMGLISQHVGQLHISQPMLAEELPSLTDDDCQSLGLRVVEPEYELVLAAAAKRKGLSFHDHLCLLLAKQKRWACLTNDIRLRRECKSEGISFQWGLDPIVDLVRHGHLPVSRARDLIEKLHHKSPGHYSTMIVKKFMHAISRSE